MHSFPLEFLGNSQGRDASIYEAKKGCLKETHWESLGKGWDMIFLLSYWFELITLQQGDHTVCPVDGTVNCSKEIHKL